MKAKLRYCAALCAVPVLVMASCGSEPELLPDNGPDEQACPAPLGDAEVNTVYVCSCDAGAASGCTPGDDSNDGRSAETPIRSFAAAQTAFGVAGPGHQVALCRGGAWATEGERFRLSPNCRAETPCVFADYGKASDPRPLIIGTQASGHTFDIALGNSDPRAGYEFRNLHVTKSDNLYEGTAFFVFRHVSDLAIRCVEVDNHRIGVQVEPASNPSARILVEHSDFHDNGEYGFLGGTSDLEIAHNRFFNNGFEVANALAHNLYVSASGAANLTIDTVVVRNNYLEKSSVDLDSGRCQGTSLTVHGGVLNDVLIEGNVVVEPPEGASGGCWGIAVDGGSFEADAAYRAIIRGNVVRDVGNVGIGLASCVDCQVDSNLVIQTQIGSSIGVAAPDRETQAPDVDQTGTVVRNNTVWFASPGGGTGIYVGQRGTGHRITSNIVAFREAAPDGVCFRYDLGAEAYSQVQANLGFNCFEIERGTSGMDASLLITDPQFVDPPLDFRLLSGSEARDSAGASADLDLLGQARGGSPDRGAYED